MEAGSQEFRGAPSSIDDRSISPIIDEGITSRIANTSGADFDRANIEHLSR